MADAKRTMEMAHVRSLLHERNSLCIVCLVTHAGEVGTKAGTARGHRRSAGLQGAHADGNDNRLQRDQHPRLSVPERNERAPVKSSLTSGVEKIQTSWRARRDACEP